MNILVIHGPNLNMLGKRNKELYGKMTLDQLYDLLSTEFPDIEFTFYQSNYEGEIIEVIHHSMDEPYDALLINPGAFTHTSIAIRDALDIITIPKVEVHLSDIDQREDFRKIDYITDVVNKRFMGKKQDSYIEAIAYLLNLGE
ncbi:MAG: type II 3-dehydroquinate dehydratase [Acholeplasmataceae bacterium]|nr:type II 3-dehydroquinate dehydratase [Acholeplasmataceae bacterium]